MSKEIKHTVSESDNDVGEIVNDLENSTQATTVVVNNILFPVFFVNPFWFLQGDKR